MDALWPHLRTDAVGTVCLVVALVLLVTGRAPAVLLGSLGIAAFCAVCPSLEKGFKFSALGLSLSGTFRKRTKKRSEALEGRSTKRPADPKVKTKR